MGCMESLLVSFFERLASGRSCCWVGWRSCGVLDGGLASAWDGVLDSGLKWSFCQWFTVDLLHEGHSRDLLTGRSC